jgi:tetratricopeptide (TPR) repeat protein
LQASSKKWIVPIAIVGGLVLVMLLSNRTVNTPEGYRVVTTNDEYSEQIKAAHELTKPIFDKADLGQPISQDEKSQLVKGAQMIDAANRLHPDFAIPFLGSGKAYLLAGQLDLAEARLRQAIANAEVDKTPGAKETGWEAWYRLGELRFKLKDYQGAYEAADQAVKSQPGSVFYLLGRARAAIQLKNLQQADLDLNAALILERDNKEAQALHKMLAEEDPGKYGAIEVALLLEQAKTALRRLDLDTADKSLHLVMALAPENKEAVALHEKLKQMDSQKFGQVGH